MIIQKIYFFGFRPELFCMVMSSNPAFFEVSEGWQQSMGFSLEIANSEKGKWENVFAQWTMEESHCFLFEGALGNGRGVWGF